PQFNPRTDFTASAIVEAPVALVSKWFKDVRPAEAPGPGETKTKSRTIDRFLNQLTIAPVRNSRLVDVKFESPDPGLSSQVTNALAKEYIDQNLEFKFLSTKEASNWLAQQLGEQRQKVEASELALQQYREQNDALSLDQRQDIVVQKLADLNGAVT